MTTEDQKPISSNKFSRTNSIVNEPNPKELLSSSRSNSLRAAESVHSPTTTRKRQLRCWALIIAGVVAQTAIIVLFVLLVMRTRNPKVRIASATLQNPNINSSSIAPSFNMDLRAQITIKNTNFGHFKFQNATVTVNYRNTNVGEGIIFPGRAKARSTKNLDVTIPVNSNNNASNYLGLSNDLKEGVLTFNSEAKVNGKIVLFKIIKKKKSVEMNCTMQVVISTLEIQNLVCK